MQCNRREVYFITSQQRNLNIKVNTNRRGSRTLVKGLDTSQDTKKRFDRQRSEIQLAS